MSRTTPTALCRTCANWLGRAHGPERRSSPRTCSAGLTPSPWVFECESHVRMSVVRPPRTSIRMAHAKRRA